MDNRVSKAQLESLPYILVRENRISEVGSQFLLLTGYNKIDVLSKEIDYLYSSLLRLEVNINTLKHSSGSYFIFTRDLEPREVEIRAYVDGEETVFVFIENTLSMIHQGFPYFEQHIKYNILGAAIFQAANFILLKANQTFLNFLDKPYDRPENSIGKSLHQICTGWTGSISHAEWEQVIQTGEPLTHKQFVYEGFKRGTTYWDVTVMPVYENGRIKYLVETATDVTENVLNRIRLEEQNRLICEQNQKLEAIIKNVTDGMFIMNMDNTVTFLNDESRKFFYNQKDYKCAGDSFVHTKYFDKHGNEITMNDLPGGRAIKGETIKDFFLTAKRPDKTMHFNISGSPLYDSDGNITSAFLCSHDITDQVIREDSIKQKKEQLEAILDNMADACAVYSKEGKLVLLNEEARKIYDILQEKNALDEAYKSFRYYDINDNVINTDDLPTKRALRGEKVKNEIVVFKSSDRVQITAINSTPIYDKENNLDIVVTSHRDITDFVRSQQEIKAQDERLIKAERERNDALKNAMKMKDEFLATITHEFKTPLAVINAALQAIDTIYGSQVSENLRKHLKRIRMNSYRQLRLVNNLLDITRYNAGHLKVSRKNVDIVFLTKAIVKSVDLYAKQKGVTLLTSSDVEFKEVAVDEEKYERILLNLLSNAIKFTPKGKSVYVTIMFKNRKALLIVRDEGVGIPKNKQKMIFERFGQVDSSLSRQAEGTGIGLSLVKTLVEGMNGTITIDSEVGRGSKFTITLPVTKVRSKKPEMNLIGSQDNRVMQAAAIEFSDIYLE